MIEKLFLGYETSLLRGLMVSLGVALSSLLVSVVLGGLLTYLELRPKGVLKKLAFGFRTVVRGVPDLVWMLLVYFGGQMLLNSFLEKLHHESVVELNNLFVSIGVIGVIFASYMSEAFRGGYLSIDQGIVEAGRALGLSKFFLFFKVILPLLIKNALPGAMNVWLTLLKSTAAVSLIGVIDLVSSATTAGNATRQPFKFWIYVTLFYLLLSWVSERLQKKFQLRSADGL